MSEAEIRLQLEKSQRLIAVLRAHLDQAESRRDELLQMLTDADGAHDRRFVAVR